MRDFTRGNIPKLMLAFLVPMLLTNTLQAVYMVIDMIWAGRLLGAKGVAIVATGMPVVFFLASLVSGITIGASILAGQAYGSKNHSLLTDIVSSSAIGVVAVSLAVSVLGVFLCGPLLRLINTPASLFDGANVFLSLIIASMALGALGQWFAAMLTAVGDSRTPFVVLVIMLALNAALAPVLITGAGIFPPLGIAGSALATILANAAGMGICLFVWRRHQLSKIAPLRFKVHWETLEHVIAVGFPMSLQMLVVSSSFLFILSLANRFGPEVTAAFGIGSRVDQFAFLAVFAVTAAISAMSAQNIGAGRFDRIPQITAWGAALSLGISFVFTAAVMLFPDAFTSLFTSDRAVIGIARNYFRIVAVGYLALALLFTYQGVLRGAGDTLASFFMIACSMVLLRVPLCFVLSHHTRLREMGLWAGITVSSFAGAGAFYLYYASGRWKKRGARIPMSPASADLEPIIDPVALQPEEDSF